VKLDGVVELKVKIDANGNAQDIRFDKEEPPFMGFGNAAVEDFSKARFIPAFREGKPVEAEVMIPVFYKAPRL
jgi:TonB family protein